MLLLSLVNRGYANAASGTADSSGARKELLDGLRAQYQAMAALQSVYVACRLELVEQRAGDPGFAWDWMEMQSALKGKMLYLRVVQPQAAVLDDGSSPGETYESQSVWNGKVGVYLELNHVLESSNRPPWNPKAEVMAEPPPRLFHWNFYWRGLGYVIHENNEKDWVERQRYPQGEFWIPACLERHGGEYTLAREREVVDGIECAVLERPGVDKLWIDRLHGYALVRRQVHWDWAGRPIRERYNYRAHQRLGEAVWLPTVVEKDQFAGPWDAEHLNNLVYRYRMTVTEMHANDVGDDLFDDVDVPTGAQCYDWRSGVYFTQYARDEEPLHKTLDDALQLPPEIRPARARRILILLGLVGIGAVTLAVWLKRSRASAADD